MEEEGYYSLPPSLLRSADLDRASLAWLAGWLAGWLDRGSVAGYMAAAAAAESVCGCIAVAKGG